MSKNVPVYSGTCYIRKRLNPKNGNKTIMWALLALKKYHKDYDSIAFTGMSGALFAPELSRVLDKNLILVRKTIKDCHSNCMVEGNSSCKKYIIVDDFICTGRTVRSIRKKIKKFAPNAVCIGILELDNLKGKVGASKVKLT